MWKHSAGEVVLTIGSPSVTPEKLALFNAFHAHGHQTKGWPDRSQGRARDGGSGLDVFVRNPFPTEEWNYRIGGRLVGVGYVDVLSQGLSAIYFFHDPQEHKRSLGTVNILHIIEAARQRGLPHVYLGYYVKGCRSLEYKTRFRPHELFVNDAWEAVPLGSMSPPCCS